MKPELIPLELSAPIRLLYAWAVDGAADFNDRKNEKAALGDYEGAAVAQIQQRNYEFFATQIVKYNLSCLSKEEALLVQSRNRDQFEALVFGDKRPPEPQKIFYK